MAQNDYPIDLRADYPEQSSRLWAVLTIFLIKLVALLPHAFILVFLSIAQVVAAIIAQVGVLVSGQYPASLFDFIAGVMRWSTRVQAFALSVTDEYPPFTLQPRSDYPVDVIAERPPASSRVYAAFTLVVEALLVVGLVLLFVWLIHGGTSHLTGNGGSSRNFNTNFGNWSAGGLLLRQIAAVPHLIVLGFIGIGVFFVWLVVQWIILFVAAYPRGLYDFTSGYLRWSVRVSGYTLGLVDRYPPFTFDPSIGGPAADQGSWPAAPPPPPPPPPPVAPTAFAPPPAAAPLPFAPPPVAAATPGPPLPDAQPAVSPADTPPEGALPAPPPAGPVPPTPPPTPGQRP